MAFSLTIFLLSLAGIVFLLVHKVQEMQKGRPILPQGMVERGDALVEEKLHQNRRAFAAKARLALRLADATIKSMSQRYLYRALHFIQAKIAELIEKLRHSMRTRAIKKEGGAVSLHLKQISEETQIKK